MSTPFKRLDLNLLKVLKVLIDVQNTRKTSELLFTSQPSISRSLQKLRVHFDDELFIRSQHGLEPTEKLLELKQTLMPIFQQLEFALEPSETFDPMKLEGTINVAINGFIANSVSAQLTHILFTRAPQVKVNIVDWGSQTYEHLTSGEIDIGINYYPLNLSKQVYQKKVATDGFILLCRKGHPLANKSLEKYQGETLALASLMVADWNDTVAFAPQALATRGIQSEIKVRSTYLHSLLTIVKESNVLFPCSQLLASSLSDEFALVEFPSLQNMPNGDIGLSISRKHRNQPKIRWLESCIEEVFKQ
ncbi:LysR family transcriptional regulator [Vibrio inusitatus NBRC 102082]|uniref:LysR family transcriptional regulator n=1 Tax=Vibrio inusitatus NBRC 102082 TaxID=1219070 RepID=A0A4Y3HZ05_9VIBR|nr:LysR family transcriptional regulator [Vibrio inusitatus]GEA51474.1 LysR family transcriptional regulator [Vibrio inusitatus NBRC 102082]